MYPVRTTDPSLVLESGRFRYRDIHSVIFTLDSGTFDGGKAYRLTLKTKASADAITTVTTFTDVGGANASCSVNLNVAALATYLGDSESLDIIATLRNDTDDESLGQADMVIYNNAARADDTPPDTPSENTYTDDQIDNLIATAPAIYSPDGTKKLTLSDDGAFQVEDA